MSPRAATTAKLVAAAALIVGLVVAVFPAARARIQSEQNWANLRASGVLRVGIDPNWQPFSFYDASGWQGYDADLARELAKRLGLRLQDDPVGYDSEYDALAQRRVDVIVSTVVPDPTKTEDAAYSDAYFDAGLYLVAPSADARATIDAALEDKRVAAALGSDADRLARFWERRAPRMTRAPVADDRAALAALAAGHADAAIVNALDVAWPLPQGARSLESRPFVVGVNKANARLLAEVNRAIDDMRADGTLDGLARKWLR